MQDPFALLDPAPRYDGLFSVHFGDIAGEAQAGLTGTVAAPLAHAGCIEVGGADAETFLQGQLTSDVRRATDQQAQLSSINSAKGRMLAVLHVFRRDGTLVLEAHRSLIDSLTTHLQRYVLRAKVTLRNASADIVGFGVAGTHAGEAVASAGLPAPAGTLAAAARDGVIVIGRHGPVPRFTVHGAPERIAALWRTLAPRTRPVGTNAWKMLDLHAGIPTIYAETQDRFVPQMANLDQLGGISFEKGCYTGQEIVARVHYLGNIKRRLFRAIVEETDPIPPGTAVLGPGPQRQTVGEVVDSARLSVSGAYLLVVLQIEHGTSSDLRLEQPDGPMLQIMN